MASAIIATLLPVLGSLAASLAPKLVDLIFTKKSDTGEVIHKKGSKKQEETIGKIIASEATKAGIKLSQEAIKKIVADLTKKPKKGETLNTQALGEPCNTHGDCSKTGYQGGETAGLFTSVGCCKDPTHDYNTCQFKKRDWAGVNYCPDVCVGRVFGGAGSCTRSSESMEEANYRKNELSNAALVLRAINDVDRPVPKYIMHGDHYDPTDPKLGTLQPDYPKTKLEVEHTIEKLDQQPETGTKKQLKTDQQFDVIQDVDLGITGSMRKNLSKVINLGKTNIRRTHHVEIINPLVKEETRPVIKT